ncbi:TPA: hypothetical protein EYP66_05215 [Candidatus Poribacteria bacterium]|nr:hypothetical protein [Candidatus Poribacteria bacterium]
MKRFWVIGLVSLLALGVIGFAIAQPYFSRSQWGMPMMGMMGRGYGNWGMPMMGMMGRGWHPSWNAPMMGAGGCPMMGGWTGRGLYGTTAPLTEEQATTIVQNYILSTGNPNLKVGKVIETEADFEVEIVTKDDSLVDRIRVDKRTGWTRSIY